MEMDHARGSRSARVTLVEYGDYECPFCARAYLVLQVALSELGDSVRFVFRNFPLDDVHPRAMNAAAAAESVAARAGETAFWRMHEMLFENQDALEIDDLLGYAEAAGAALPDVAADLASGASRARIERDIRLAAEDGVRGTPAFFINGHRFDGDWTDADAFTEALKTAARERALH
ncbi:MAG TPA: DsbA family protein [Vicinamibacterales bacterium]|nr:DsbA family protein [Vicinamibacterales bacterium]